jgi:hypothetical protein
VSACPELGDPVCGADGLTYWNECLATLQNVQVTKKGYCEGEIEACAVIRSSISAVNHRRGLG